MKKVIAGIAGLIFTLFGFGIIALVVSLTYSALGRIFPGSFENQIWGLVLFDLAAIAWALGFAFQSKSAGQYIAAGAGFITAMIGTIGMIAAEVMLSGNQLTGGTADTAEIGRTMIYTFIGCSVIHLLLLYAHHAADPEMATQITTGISRGEVRSRALKDAEKQLAAETPALAQAITQDIVSQVKRDLQLTPIDNTIFDRRQEPREYPAELPSPIIEPTTETKEAGDNKPSPFLKSQPE